MIKERKSVVSLGRCRVDRTVDIPISREGIRTTGTFISFQWRDNANVKEHFAIGLGDWKNVEIPTVRLHSECMTGDVFNSERCDCGDQLAEALRVISECGGFVLYLRQEGRGIGLYNKFAAYRLQDEGYDTYQANEKLGFTHDLRNFDVAADMLKALKANRIILHTNNDNKRRQLENEGIQIEGILNTGVYEKDHNRYYLHAKQEVGGHSLKLKSI
ncbi:MAG: GTP cyclohydrolase II RibA [Bacteroidota bacterium]